MKKALSLAALLMTFACVGHADPIIECPPDFPEMTHVEISLSPEGQLSALVQSEDSVTELREETVGAVEILKLMTDRNCRQY